ncbi:hypothetical protein Cni_G17301 [Canna indica]|uniref:Uncharacterized protein n=1 Tax=Canna indica TaxID=4628 RepID=A0AAQ3QGM1_9LILI|nr:hypothetical protein Cni_G17301 [Canna indica]
MARILSQSLIRDTCSSHRLLFARLFALRGRSDARIVEVDLGAGAEVGEDDAEVDVLSLRRLEEAIHAISIRRSAPEWLPFVPGSSYWVPPPRRAAGVVELVRKIADPLTEEETMSLTNVRGWPSSAYFVEGISPHSAKKKSKKASAQSDDEE